MAKHKDYERQIKRDVAYFLNMCSKDDATLFLSDAKEKRIDDFGRFICLGLAFSLRGVYLTTFVQFEKIGEVTTILNYMDSITYAIAEKWIEEFLANIKTSILKECAQSIWEEKKKYFVNHKFKLSKLC